MFFQKKLRRNSLDFIFDNPWIKLIFSFFIGSVTFVILAIFTIKISTTNSVTTLMYFTSFIVFGNLFLQFPLIILSIRHSNSFNTVKQIIEKISISDIEYLYKPNYGYEDANLIENLEKNRIIQIKDIGVSSIKEDDWGMPQTILNNLFEKLIQKSDLKTKDSKQLNRYLYAYTFVSRHFQKVAINLTDEITTKVALGNLFRIHYFFVENKIKNLRNNPADSVFKDLLRNISDNSAYYNIQEYLLVNLTRIIGEHINSISYTDEELPTLDYIFTQDNFEHDKKDKLISDYWFYIKNELPSLFFEILHYAIETGNKNIYYRFNWHVESLLSIISNSKNLTVYQENELFEEFLFKANKLYELAIDHKIYKDITTFNHIYILLLIEKRKKYAFRVFYNFSYLVLKLNKLNNLNVLLIDEYFMIGRGISSNKNKKEDKEIIFENIINNGFEIYNLKTTLPETKQEIKNQLKWLNQFIERDIDLVDIKIKYFNKITKFK